MRSEMRILVIMAAFGLLLITADAAVAQPDGPITDTFWVEVGENGVIGGGGSGFNGGEWYYYENTDWWNVWFYDHPYDPTRWKKIDIAFTIAPLDLALDSWAEVTYNWSTPFYPPNPGEPPLPDGLPLELENEWIMRADPSIFVGELSGDPICIIDSIIIPDYNPEWISVDIRGFNFVLDGCITHECIPEPATMSLLVLGGIGALIKRRRK